MREGCEVHTGDLRVPRQARAAMHGCSHVIHLAAFGGVAADATGRAFTLTEANGALCSTVLRAALDAELERFVYVSCASVFERAELFPTPEDHLRDCPVALSPHGFSKLAGEMCCRAAHQERGVPYTICRPADVYGPGEVPDAEPGVAHVVADLIGKVLRGQRPLEILGSGAQTRTFTHVEDVAEAIVTAMSSPAGANEDFNISSARELAVAELARIVWQACGEDPAAFALEHVPAPEPDVQRRCPSAEKAMRLLGWEARIELEDGIAGTVRWLRDRHPIAVAR